MNCFILFLYGSYRRIDIPFYKQLCHSKSTIAIDGGYSFFRKAGFPPDILIGDFDSLKRFPRDLPKTTTVLNHPPRKDKTDLHLAMDFCFSKKARTIDVVQPSVGDIDHFLGNALLLAHNSFSSGNKRQPRIRIINPKYEINLVVNTTLTFRDCVGDTVSVLALSPEIILDITGAEYKAKSIHLAFGETRGLRNHITSHSATCRIGGKALVVRNFEQRYGL